MDRSDFEKTSNNDYEFVRNNSGAPMGGNYGNNHGQGGFDTTPMTMGEWVITLLIMCIPCVNIIMCFVWGFGSTGNLNRRNFCRAQLIFIAVAVVLYLLIFVVIGIGAASTYPYGNSYHF